MSNTIPAGTLVLVADGEGARVFRNVGDDKSLVLQQQDMLELMNMNDDGPAGSMPTESTGKQVDEATFAKQLALRLNAGALKGEFEHLVLIADPQTLGQDALFQRLFPALYVSANLNGDTISTDFGRAIR